MEAGPPHKRVQSLISGPSLSPGLGQEVGSGVSASQQGYIRHWAEEANWPDDYFQQDSMSRLLARRKSTASLSRKRSESSLASSATPSDQKPREEKGTPYRSQGYRLLLERLGASYMVDCDLGATQASKDFCDQLLRTECDVPRNSLFHDDVLPTACRNLENKNEARVIQDISRLLVPSPETLAAFGFENVGHLVESVNEGWNNCITITNPRPQPDFSVGFKRPAFSDEQLEKLEPLIGDPFSLSYLAATYYLYFPFLSCETKCGTAALELADRQNAHSMTIAVRGLVELFRLVNREQEIDREILTYSVSHDHRMVKLYGHYAQIQGKSTKYYRHLIHSFDIAALDGKERWTTYKFITGVYRHSLTLLRRIASVVDELASPGDAGLEQQAELEASEPPGSGVSVREAGVQAITPDASTNMEQATGKRRKGKGKA